MTGDDLGRLLYLVLLLVFVGGWVLRGRARGRGQALRHAGSWVLIFAVAVAGAALWDDIRRDAPQPMMVSQSGAIEVPRAVDGHYYLTARINGEPVDFLVDTGATDIVLSMSDAEQIGIEPRDLVFSGRAGTANGEVRTAQVRFDEMQVGPLVDRNVFAHVNAGDMHVSLLGMNYLRRFERIEITDDRLILER